MKCLFACHYLFCVCLTCDYVCLVLIFPLDGLIGKRVGNIIQYESFSQVENLPRQFHNTSQDTLKEKLRSIISKDST